MTEYGTLHESNGRYILNFERFTSNKLEDVFIQIVNGEPMKWPDNSDELRKYYREAFNVERI